MSNTITAFFKGRVGVAEAVYQNDYGIVMNLDSIELPAHFDCYFSTLAQDEAIPGIGADNQVAIPNDCLTRAGSVMLHIPLHTGANDSEVEYIVYFKVIGRARPVDDGTPVQQTAIEQALALLQNPIGNIEQIVNEALSFTGDTFAEMQEQLDADQAAFQSDMGDRADAFEAQIQSDISDVESDFDNLNAQYQTAVAAHTVDSEVQNVRVGADNVTYASAGEAVRTQVTNLKNDANLFNEFAIGKKNYYINIGITSNKYINDSGVETSNTGSFYTDLIPLDSGTYTLIWTSTGTSAFRIHGYKDGVWVKMIAKWGRVGENLSTEFEINNNEIDAIKISGNKVNITIKLLINGNSSIEAEIENNADYSEQVNKYALGVIDYLKDVEKASGAYINDSGVVTQSTSSYYTDLIPLPTGTFNLIYSSTNISTAFRIHGYKDGVWVKMIAKIARLADYSSFQFAINHGEIDSIRLTGNVAITTPHFLFNATDTDKETEELSRFYHGPYKCNVSDFEDWYRCMATDAEINSYSFGRDKSYADTIALFDTLVDGKYVTKHLLKHIDALDIDIYEYVFKPKAYTRSPNTAEGLAQFRRTPKVLLDAGMHGFEKGGVFANFLFLYDLVHNWQDNKSLENIRNYVEIHCNPIVNPYGFENNTYCNENEVNINRNFGSSTWEYHEAGTQGSGDEPFDQAETQMVVDWVSANSDALAYIDHHTNGQYYAVEPLGLNLCYLPSADYGDSYSRRWYNVVNKHIEKQTLMYLKEFADVDFHLEDSTTQNSYLGRYQQTTHTGTVDVWSLENATVPAMTLECINGWKSSDNVANEDAEIPLFSNTAMRIGAENVGNFICQLLQEFCV